MGTEIEVTDAEIDAAIEKWSAKVTLNDVLEDFESDRTAKSVLDASTHRNCPILIGSVMLAVRKALIERLALADVYCCYVVDLPRYVKTQDAGQAAVSAANAWALSKASSK
ncbi:MAG: hypothetical protein KGI52_12450 [Burkholderiales bacterium]|nr:hypothetical protein [Burkholderiales bacterium]